MKKLPPMHWFGPSGDHPLREDADRIDSPIGDSCHWCAEPIERTEYGMAGAGVCFHQECYTRWVVGPAAHLLHECGCGKRQRACDDAPGLSPREAARAAHAVLGSERWEKAITRYLIETVIAVDIKIDHEPGWQGAFTRQRAAEALYDNGTRIKKAKSEPKDATPLGTQGTILGSIYTPEAGLGYFVEWDDKPRVAVFVVGWKLVRASAGLA